MWLSRTCKHFFLSFPAAFLPVRMLAHVALSVCACCSLPPVFAYCPIEKECDLNKHLKVRNPEGKKLCGRELICNVCYSLVVVGRLDR